MKGKFKCFNCNATTIILEVCEDKNDFYGVCSLCGFRYLVTRPDE